MEISKKVKIISRTCEILGINNLFYLLNKNRKKVIAYHNVIEDRYFDESLHLTYSTCESAFRAQVALIKEKFKIDLDVYNDKSVMITFDDGYKNQTVTATKILDEFNVKGIIFCPVNAINSKEPLDMDKVLCWFSYVPTGTYKIEELSLELTIGNSLLERNIALNKAVSFIDKSFYLKDLVRCLDHTFKFKDLKYDGYECRFASPTIEDINDAKKRGHIIASHSRNHDNLASLSEESLKADIDNCGHLLKEGVYNSGMFAYPYGGRDDVPSITSEFLEKNNFEVAFAYTNTNVYEYDKYYIPRFTLPNTNDRAVINFNLSGARYFFKTRKLFPKWN
ncbi:MAG: polysaccharide deacetylase family protein [Sarcina sp.]